MVAAVNGHAIAGGCVLACCADRRIAARDGGRIGVTELLVGVPFPALAFEVMRFATAPQYFPETILSGATYPPDVALRAGWSTNWSSRRTCSIARSPRADAGRAVAGRLRATKQQIRQPLADAWRRDGDAHRCRRDEIWTAPETLAHIRDYVARTFKKS